ncbi:MAG: flagellar basal body rod protein FlgB [Phenylobacterium sp.]|uniref:flagellar basal body rod protein FlgB n=1 Tax=Phenylobacterium sp. TaxID=1871053 RepID=UPI002734105F|nr:flagellar basal body rod protein FlgB [Phenylobacterium sp.]MDP3173416.1 flagellar basal body rod protein FlgB [Phenylobacterium sp.]
MDLAGIPLFAMLRSRLGYLSERERVIAENVSNSDTPGYRPQDLKPFSFEARVTAAMSAAGGQAITQPGHMTSPSVRRPGVKSIRTHDSETTLDGNSVVLEDEMLKMTDARMNYDAAIGFYQKSINMLRLATRPPGRG